MTDYESMSDFEINKAVAHAKLLTTEHKTGKSKYKCSPDGYMIVRQESLIYYPFDPVNNESQAWPIITKNKINICFQKNGSNVMAGEPTGINHTCENPLRAAMIVFLMMQESEQ